MKQAYLLTGVTRGLGRALLEECVRSNIFVFGCGRSKKEIEKLQELYQDRVHCTVLDIVDAEAVDAWAHSIRSHALVPTVIINNAGVINRNSVLWEISDAEFTRIFDVNVRGSVNVIRSFMPLLLNAGMGTIVNFSSGWGRSTSPEVAPYCGTKWAIEGISQSLAQELPANFCCVALNPGIINTAMLQSCFGAAAAEYPLPEAWAKRALQRIKSIKPGHNGQAISV